MRSPNKSCELDPFPTELIKKCLPQIAPAITRVINSSLESGEVPSALKIAVIRPTLKKPNLDKESLRNYRPISNLPFVSKILERISFSRLMDYLQNNEFLDSHQSAYRSHHSVETLLTDETNT